MRKDDPRVAAYQQESRWMEILRAQIFLGAAYERAGERERERAILKQLEITFCKPGTDSSV
jgi:hypothetical protein